MAVRSLSRNVQTRLLLRPKVFRVAARCVPLRGSSGDAAVMLLSSVYCGGGEFFRVVRDVVCEPR